jgi:hypothetical protein
MNYPLTTPADPLRTVDIIENAIRSLAFHSLKQFAPISPSTHRQHASNHIHNRLDVILHSTMQSHQNLGHRPPPQLPGPQARDD